MDIVKIDYKINFFKKELQFNKYNRRNSVKIINTNKWDFFFQKRVTDFFKKTKNPYTRQKVNFIFNNNLKKTVFVSRYANIPFLKKDRVIKIIVFLNKLKKNSNAYKYIFFKKSSPRQTSLTRALNLHQNELKKANNDVKDDEYADYLEKINSYVEKKKKTTSNKGINRLNRLIRAVPQPLDEGRKYFLNNMFFLKNTPKTNRHIRRLSRDSSFFLRNFNLIFFHNFLKKKKKLLTKTDNFIVKLFRKKYMYYYSMVFLNEDIIKAISPGILLKFFEITEKHKKKNKKALRLMIKTLARLYGKFNKKFFNKIFIIEFFDKGIIETLSGIKNLSYRIDFIFINFKFCKEKRSFKKARLFKRNKVKKLLKINLDYIKKLNFKKKNERYNKLFPR